MQFGKFSVPALLTLEQIDDALNDCDDITIAPLHRLDLVELKAILDNTPITSADELKCIEEMLRESDPFGYYLIENYL